MTTTNGYKYTDFTYLNNLVMGDNEFKKKIINMFIDKTPAIIKNIQDSYQNRDFASVKSISHKFKSSIDFVGSKDLALKMVDLEKNAENENLDLVEKGIQDVEKLCNEVYSELKIELSKL